MIARPVIAEGDDAERVANAIVDGLRAPDLRCAFVFTDYRFDSHVIAAVTHRGLVNYLRWAAEAYPVGEAPVHSPLSFDLTVTSLPAGHWLPLERTAELVEVMRGWLRGKGL